MLNVLLVENNHEFFDDYEKVLKEKGFNVIKAKNYYDAYSLIIDMIFEVIVLDVQNVTDKHYEFVSAIRSKTSAQIVVLSESSQENTIISFFDAGVDDYQRKPYSPLTLVHKIMAILRRNEFLAQNSLTIGPFTFDYIDMVCFFKDEPLDLTLTEYKILFNLANNLTRVVSKQQLYQLVWDAELSNHSDALWAAISRLKKKIEPYENDFSIDSNREGYQLYIREQQ